MANKNKPIEEKSYKDKSGHKRPLTIKQRKFIEEVTKSGNATEAAAKVYKTKNNNSAGVIGSQNLRKLNIKESIEERVNICKNIIFSIATNPEAKDEVKIKAAQDVIDRVEGKATQKVENNLKLDESIKGIKIEIS